MYFIGVEVEQEMSAPPPEKNPGSPPGREVVVVGMFDKNSQCMGCLPGQKSGCCREVVVEDRWL